MTVSIVTLSCTGGCADVQVVANGGFEPYRYARQPTQAITYLLGRLEIERLKEDYRKAQGPAYDEARFHREFLGYGPILPALIREAMLGPRPVPAGS